MSGNCRLGSLHWAMSVAVGDVCTAGSVSTVLWYRYVSSVFGMALGPAPLVGPNGMSSAVSDVVTQILRHRQVGY